MIIKSIRQCIAKNILQKEYGLFKLTKYLKGYWGVSIIGAIFKLSEAIFELIVPVIMADIIDTGIANSDVKYILTQGGILIALGISGLVLALTCQYLASRSAQGFGTRLRRELYSHINGLSFNELDKFGSSSLVTRLTSDIYQAEKAVAMTIRLASRVPFLIIGSAVMAVILNWKLSIIFLIIAPVIGITLYFIMKKSVPYYKRNQEKLDSLNSIARESLGGSRVIRAYAGECDEIERFEKETLALEKNAIKVGKIANLLNPFTTVILNIGIIAIIYFGAFQVNVGDMSQGEVIAFVNYINQIMLAIIVFSQLIAIYTRAGASADRINEVLDTVSTVKDPEDTNLDKEIINVSNAENPSKIGTTAELLAKNSEIAISANNAVNAISADNIDDINAEKLPKIDTKYLVEFDDVTFSYGGDPALSGVSFKLKRGELLGIIGGTGSGKSTLINLIPRFYDVGKGEIFYCGKNIKDFSVKDLRSRIGLAPQKARLFRGTIADNIRWGKRDATDQEVKSAAKLALADEFVERMPSGYDSTVSSNARNLSGGQVQRLTIARALIRKPELLILDDSSSALDYVTDLKLRRNIRKLKLTAIIVSQRVSSIMDADNILVLSEGRVIGSGKHSELLATCPEYADMYRSQNGGEEVACE